MAKLVNNLRTYLEHLSSKEPDSLLRIKRQISCAYEINELQRKLEHLNKFPVLCFDNIKTIHQKQSKFPLVTNLTASRSLCAKALGLNQNRIALDFNNRIAARIEPEIISSGQAPVKEVILKGAKVDLYKFPLTIHNDGESFPYISAGNVITIDRESKIDNISLQRLGVREKNQTTIYPAPYGHNAANMKSFWQKKESAPAAVWIGHHPLALLGSLAKLNYPESHYPAMGGALSNSVGVVASETFGSDILVPAEAEIVLEGYISYQDFVTEAPVGEYTGYLGAVRHSPVFNIECITLRSDAYYHNIGLGFADHLMMLMLFFAEANIFDQCSQQFPAIKNVHVPLSGRRNHAYIQINANHKGLVEQLLAKVFEVDQRIKHCIVVDEDIDIFNEKEVLASLAYRTQGDQDVYVFQDLPSSPLDPSVKSPPLGAKVGVDATISALAAGLAFPKRTQSPIAVREKISVTDYLEAKILKNIPTENC